MLFGSIKRRAQKGESNFRFANTRSRKEKGLNRFPWAKKVAWGRGGASTESATKTTHLSTEPHQDRKFFFHLEKRERNRNPPERADPRAPTRGIEQSAGNSPRWWRGGGGAFFSPRVFGGRGLVPGIRCAATTKTGRVAAALEVGAARRTRTRRGGWACACGCGAVRVARAWGDKAGRTGSPTPLGAQPHAWVDETVLGPDVFSGLGAVGFYP